MPLLVECGDNLDDYDHDGLALAQRPNGDCVYLGADGCTIFTRQPAWCRSFDCRSFFIKYDARERRQLVKRGLVRKEVMHAALQRVKTITPEMDVIESIYLDD